MKPPPPLPCSSTLTVLSKAASTEVTLMRPEPSRLSCARTPFPATPASEEYLATTSGTPLTLRSYRWLDPMLLKRGSQSMGGRDVTTKISSEDHVIMKSGRHGYKAMWFQLVHLIVEKIYVCGCEKFIPAVP